MEGSTQNYMSTCAHINKPTPNLSMLRLRSVTTLSNRRGIVLLLTVIAYNILQKNRMVVKRVINYKNFLRVLCVLRGKS